MDPLNLGIPGRSLCLLISEGEQPQTSSETEAGKSQEKLSWAMGW
jgi:hypothetical protein